MLVSNPLSSGFLLIELGMKEKGRKVSIVIFYEPEGDIVFQERGKASKLGEKYAFFGGGIEEGESSLEALKRE